MHEVKIPYNTSFAPESFQIAKAIDPVPRIANTVPIPRALRAKLAPVSAISIEPAIPLLKKFGSDFFAVASVRPKPANAEIPKKKIKTVCKIL